MSSISRLRLLTLLCLVLAPQQVAALTRFRSWFPRYASGLNYAVDNNCSTEYMVYNNNTIDAPELDGELGIWLETSKAGHLIGCILDSVPELVKANFASAAVMLGLMPALLAVIGPSIQETSTLLALGDHPLLALLLCVGSPLIGLDRELHIRGAFRTLKSESVDIGLRRSLWLTCVEYIIAMAAIANIAEMSWELAFKVSFSWFQEDAFLLGVWSFVGFVVHLLGALTLSTCLSMDHNADIASISTLSLMSKWLRWRFSFAKRDGDVRVIFRKPSLVYYLFVAFATLLIVSQITFGTMLFSGVLFIGVGDAVGVFFRYMASVIACRVLVLVELALLQRNVQMEDAEDSYTAVSQSTTIKK